MASRRKFRRNYWVKSAAANGCTWFVQEAFVYLLPVKALHLLIAFHVNSLFMRDKWTNPVAYNQFIKSVRNFYSHRP